MKKKHFFEKKFKKVQIGDDRFGDHGNRHVYTLTAIWTRSEEIVIFVQNSFHILPTRPQIILNSLWSHFKVIRKYTIHKNPTKMKKIINFSTFRNLDIEEESKHGFPQFGHKIPKSIFSTQNPFFQTNNVPKPFQIHS